MHNVDYIAEVKPRVLKIIREVFKSGVNDILDLNADHSLVNSFGYFRVDFLFDQAFNPYLLEVEIVPSTGSIGGIDGMLKRRVMHDTIGILSANSIEEKIRLNEIRNAEEISYVSEEGRSGRGTGGFECLIPCWNGIDDDDYDDYDDYEEEEEEEEEPGPVHILTFDDVFSKCNECTEQNLEFCVTPSSLFNREFQGRCQPKGTLCKHDMHPLYDSTLVKKCDASQFEYGSVAFGKMVVDSGLIYNGNEEEVRGMKDLCSSVFLEKTGYVYASDVPELSRLLYFCNTNEPHATYPNRYGEISLNDAMNGKLEEFVRLNYPAVIRGGSSQALRDWDHKALAEEFREEHVNALIFDGAEDGSEISAAGMTFAEFCEYR